MKLNIYSHAYWISEYFEMHIKISAYLQHWVLFY